MLCRDHETDPKSHVYENNKLPGHEIDFANVEILDRANTFKKLELKEMIHIRKHKPSLNKQLPINRILQKYLARLGKW